MPHNPALKPIKTAFPKYKIYLNGNAAFSIESNIAVRTNNIVLFCDNVGLIILDFVLKHLNQIYLFRFEVLAHSYN